MGIEAILKRSSLSPKNLVHFSICACHPCAGAMLIFSVSFQFYRMIPEGNPFFHIGIYVKYTISSHGSFWGFGGTDDFHGTKLVRMVGTNRDAEIGF